MIVLHQRIGRKHEEHHRGPNDCPAPRGRPAHNCFPNKLHHTGDTHTHRQTEDKKGRGEEIVTITHFDIVGPGYRVLPGSIGKVHV